MGREKKKLKKGRREKREEGLLSLLSLLLSYRKRNTHTHTRLPRGKSRARTTFWSEKLTREERTRAERILTREKETIASRHGEKQRAQRETSLSLTPFLINLPPPEQKKAKTERRLLSQRRKIVEKTYYEPSPKITQSQV